MQIFISFFIFGDFSYLLFICVSKLFIHTYLRLMIFLYGQLLAIGRATTVSVCGSRSSFKVHRSCIKVVCRARRAMVALTKNPYRPLTAFIRPVVVSKRDSRLLNAFMYN